MDDYYALLGVTPAAGAREIRAAFRHLAKRLHPDVSRLPSAADRFRRVMEAYETLGDPVRRAAYDAAYRSGLSTPRPAAPTGTYSASGYRAAPSTQRAPGPPTPPQPTPGPPAAPAERTPTSTKRPTRPRGPLTPVAPISPVGAVSPLSASERARRAAEAIRATAVRVRCSECGTLVSADADACPSCLQKYGTFQEHLARAVARSRRR